MANIEVEVQANLLDEPIKIRALIAACSKTQISKRLAIKLGLFEDAKDIFVKDEEPLSMGNQWLGRWKISLKPMVIKCYPSEMVDTQRNGERAVVVAGYPLINMEVDDAFHEMIIGRDYGKHSISRINFAIESTVGPTPGPSYEEDVCFTGHNIGLAGIEEVPKDIKEFFEYPPFILQDIKRLALNKVTKQLIVMYKKTNLVVAYNGLPFNLEKRLEQVIYHHHIDDVPSVLVSITQICEGVTIDAFPKDTILVDWSSM